ncbi:hypothetical protein [Bacillus sp. FSL K6-3431]|uniref:hypothetical protein n=1 Tax=Bacillus sp. FSL K6-3431 TaxID=2921500 RepID=UPI0030F55E9D
MKKYIIFTTSFLLLFSLFQLFSGLFLTLTYIPDIAGVWHSNTNLTQEVVFGENFFSLFSTFIFAILSAIISYFASNKFAKNNKRTD